MTTGEGNTIFLDTNVLVYASQAESPFHQAAQRAIQDLYDRRAELWISRQVLREYIAALTRPGAFTDPEQVATLIADVRRFQSRFLVAEDNREVTERLLALLERIRVGGKHVHDANIVATMQAHGIRRLLTNNPADFARFSHLITVVPLEAGGLNP
ncbi:MAG: type II toxin-antitoxin system VapC family toxin [Chloroflexi bacterium]|nr:type II toxin-antitoxin system VapC family toxin [Chloroflexota bacterium]